MKAIMFQNRIVSLERVHEVEICEEGIKNKYYYVCIRYLDSDAPTNRFMIDNLTDAKNLLEIIYNKLIED